MRAIVENARAVAEENVAIAGRRAAEAQIAAAAALSAPPPGPTDAELLRTFMLTYMANGIASATALSKAKADVAAYRKATAAPYAVPL